MQGLPSYGLHASMMTLSVREIEAEGSALGDHLRTAIQETDDAVAARRARQAKELDDLHPTLEESRAQVGVDPNDLKTALSVALNRLGTSLDAHQNGHVGNIPLPIRSIRSRLTDGRMGRDSG